MDMDKQRRNLLRQLPGVDTLLKHIQKEPQWDSFPTATILTAIRKTLDQARSQLLEEQPLSASLKIDPEELLNHVKARIISANEPNLKVVINATGVVVHTNLGRSLLASSALEQVNAVAGRYSNLEFDLEKGLRGSRYSLVQDLLCEISGAEAAMVVNNNAGAVFLSLDTVARGKNVIISRGELVEIGGAFRVPDVMAKSGAFLKEVGTTNRTHPKDYVNAIDDATGLLLKVHTSNYSIVGFTAAVSLPEMVAIGNKHNLPVMEDLGSGTFIDFSHYGLSKEPTVQESVAAGVHLITFSGDKLLGGPQAGIILGHKKIIDKIKANPLTRALRIDKLTLAALESTLRLYRDEASAIVQIPTLKMITAPLEVIQYRARKIRSELQMIIQDKGDVTNLDLSSRAGGGALPMLNLPSRCVGLRLKEFSANAIERFLRAYSPPIIGRIESDQLILDPRTIQDDEIPVIKQAVTKLLERSLSEA